jgi:anti-sigma factor RsiW
VSCLGEKLTALVDGELDHDARDRALAHLATCADCRAEADTLRRLKSRLRALAEGPREPAHQDERLDERELELPSVDFLNRLYALGEQPSSPPLPTGPARMPVSRPRDNRPAGRAALGARVAGRRVPRRRALAVSAAAAVVLGLGTASYAVGGETEQPAVVPAFNELEAEHALTNGLLPLTGTSPGP